MTDVLPWLLLAVCPLAMLLMMRGMSGSSTSQASPNDAAAQAAKDARLAELEAQVRDLTGRATRPDPTPDTAAEPGAEAQADRRTGTTPMSMPPPDRT